MAWYWQRSKTLHPILIYSSDENDHKQFVITLCAMDGHEFWENITKRKRKNTKKQKEHFLVFRWVKNIDKQMTKTKAWITAFSFIIFFSLFASILPQPKPHQYIGVHLAKVSSFVISGKLKIPSNSPSRQSENFEP